MQEEIYQLLYLSSAIKGMNEDTILDILEKSREKNSKKGISGFLLFSEGNIIQLLKGEKEQVDALYARIEKDDRHYRVMKLISEHTEKRDFPDWSMGFSNCKYRDLVEGVSGFNNLLNPGFTDEESFQEISTKIQIFIKTFRQSTGVDAHYY